MTAAINNQKLDSNTLGVIASYLKFKDKHLIFPRVCKSFKAVADRTTTIDRETLKERIAQRNFKPFVEVLGGPRGFYEIPRLIIRLEHNSLETAFITDLVRPIMESEKINIARVQLIIRGNRGHHNVPARREIIQYFVATFIQYDYSLPEPGNRMSGTNLKLTGKSAAIAQYKENALNRNGSGSAIAVSTRPASYGVTPADTAMGDAEADYLRRLINNEPCGKKATFDENEGPRRTETTMRCRACRKTQSVARLAVFFQPTSCTQRTLNAIKDFFTYNFG